MARQNIHKVAIVGLGMVAETHVKAVADLKDTVELVGLLGRDPQRAEKFKEKTEAIIGKPCRLFQDIDEVAADPEVDFVIIVTPPNARMDIVKKLATSGKAILMEKPVERTSEAAEKIVNICIENDTPLGIVFQHRVRPVSEKIKTLIESGKLGKLSIVDIVVPWWRDQSYYDEPGRGTYQRDGGGVLISQAIHSLDLMLSLCGPVSKVQAIARTTRLHQMESEDYVSAGLDFENGAIGSLLATTASFPGETESITMHFEKAVAVLKAGQLKIHWRDGNKETIGENSSSGGGADPMAFTHEWHANIISDFSMSLRERREPVIPGRTALKVHYLIDALVKSSDLQKSVEVKF